ncbi:leucine efflux protein LeuE [Burkholderia thailandensis]|uniref:Homoserine/threonine efflux protein, putative n=1 Tax=Burkholderia thailandensis (strain ATCC 700388 / DSM 13276 / CCUG 48851 / CIP 106301 / E264) TaxID=271848 RepID=Q2SUV5_BURTA|nr:leucine efflux protein LeuE [Burkholderia thailandensis]ABC39127.1 homoserine/threonine efflux protein, putative [Burkholderia thailandensis E264]AHI72773.1 leucine efflux protein [Burkholderia thailandensis 2002721723]AIP25255.1 lysE type translocator family protein [Burkholderia thailandensis E264]AJY00011.1 lysE type translocator family protein [Burkholderia thailandensis 2002721643]MCS3399412.1 leucine efflux protein LeuE [Burkholderia thailandensis]
MFGHALGITDLWTYVFGVVFIILLPGPNSMYVLSLAAQRGVKAGYRAACGVFVGDTVLMVLSAAGVASLLKANPLLFSVVKYGGAAYLLYIGAGMLRGAWRKLARPADAGADVRRAVDGERPFRKALVVSLLNPKAILFFISFFIQFVDPSYAHPALSFVVLGAIAQFASFVYLSTLIFTGARLADHFRRRRKLAAGASGGVGGLFVGFSVKLALATMS